MPTPVKPKRSFTAQAVPTAADIHSAGELVLNWADKIAYTKDASGNVIAAPLGGSGSSGLTWSAAPASATASGTAGQIAWDSSYYYVCVAANTWVRTPLTTWTPVDSIAGLQLWLDASDASTLYDDTSGGNLAAADGTVARWQDKSGNGRHATQATSGSRPLRKTSVQNGRAVLRFDGTDDFLSVPSSTAMFNFLHNGDSTVFLVFKGVGNTDATNIDLLISNNIVDVSIDGQTGYYLRWDNRAGSATLDRVVSVVSNGGNTRLVAVSGANTFAAGSAQLVTMVGNPQQSTIADRVSIRRNGGSAVSLTTSDTNAATALPTGNATQDLRIAAGHGTTIWSLNGDICEIIMYDSALSDANRAAVESYLVSKWGLA